MRLAGALLFVTACVPSTDDLTPAGAGGYTLEPTAATRGESFETTDGYVVTVDTLVVLVDVSVTPTHMDADGFPPAVSDRVLISGRTTEAYAPGAAAGEAVVRARFSQLLFGAGYSDVPTLSADLRPYLPRFQRAADVPYVYTGDNPRRNIVRPPQGPSLLFAFHAAGGGRSYRMDVTLELGDRRFATDSSATLVVAADTLVTAPLAVRAEVLFSDAPACNGLCTAAELADLGLAPAPKTFAPFIACDQDDDGIVTSAELQASRTGGSTFADELAQRAARLFTTSP